LYTIAAIKHQSLALKLHNFYDGGWVPSGRNLLPLRDGGRNWKEMIDSGRKGQHSYS